MISTDQDLERRRPVWDALSNFFLDTEVDDDLRRHIARVVVESGYSPSDTRTILWDEVFPVLEFNLRSVAGEWAGFDLEWLQQRILSRRSGRSLWMRILGVLPYSTARIVRNEWVTLLPFLPERFSEQHKAT